LENIAMPIDQEGLYKNITLTDIQLAAAYYPILIDLAKHKQCLPYGELVEKAKKIYPSNTTVKNAIAVSTGRRLDVVRLFTNERELPDLTSLIVNKNSGECGIGFTQHFDPVSKREEVYSYEWSGVSPEFDIYIQNVQKEITPRKKVSKKAALKLMSRYYKENKKNLPDNIVEKREFLIEMLMEGFSDIEVFELAVNAV
jgi:hypothetical protein